MTISYNISQISDVAQQLIAKVSSKSLCFYGEMGAGKTTLIKALVKEVGGGSRRCRRTFGIVKEYNRDNGELLGYHFECSRLTDEPEAWVLGLEENLGRDTWIF